jgi:tetratricopeptide (TPR) repeat protein
MTADLLMTGWRFHQAGDLPRAEEAYRRLVQQEPGNAQAWFLLGALCQARGDLAAALTSLEQALRLRPEYPEALHHQGIVFIKQKRFAEAMSCFQRALQLEPRNVEIQTNLALVLAHQGQHAEAVSRLQAALAVQPDYARAQTQLQTIQAQQAAAEGSAYLERKQFAEAADRFRQVLRLRPESAEAHRDLGRALACQGQLDEAIASYQQALRLRPDFAEAHHHVGVLLRQQKRFTEAEASIRAAVRLRPDLPELHDLLAETLLDQKRPAEAEASCRAALQLRPEMTEAHNNLGRALLEQDRLTEAMACFERALQLLPDFAQAHNNRAVALWQLERFEEAFAGNARALQLQPDFADPHANTGMLWLLLGDFEKGWPEYEWRWQRPDCPSRSFTQPRWDGSSLAGRTILLYAEQGLGDTIQFARYPRLLKEQGGTVIVECQRALLPLLARCLGIDRLVSRGEPLPPHDVRAPLLSVPYHLGTRLDTIPASVPYLEADPALVERWRQQLAALPGFKIGINWQGNPQFRLDRQRSFPLEEFAPLAAVRGVQLVSLQHGPAAEQLRAVAGRWPITDLGGRLDEEAGPFMDRAAVMKGLDLVVTSDTSIAHLAGALGVPVWVALGKVPYWCYLMEREDCPWYPTMRLFRQEQRGDWASVFRRIALAVQRLTGERRTSAP